MYTCAARALRVRVTTGNLNPHLESRVKGEPEVEP